ARPNVDATSQVTAGDVVEVHLGFVEATHDHALEHQTHNNDQNKAQHDTGGNYNKRLLVGRFSLVVQPGLGVFEVGRQRRNGTLEGFRTGDAIFGVHIIESVVVLGAERVNHGLDAIAHILLEAAIKLALQAAEFSIVGLHIAKLRKAIAHSVEYRHAQIYRIQCPLAQREVLLRIRFFKQTRRRQQIDASHHHVVAQVHDYRRPLVLFIDGAHQVEAFRGIPSAQSPYHDEQRHKQRHHPHQDGADFGVGQSQTEP